MITLTKGDIVKAHTEAIVNSVNTVGVMGKGVALSFKNAFPENFIKYKKVCDNGDLDIGKLLITETHQLYPKYIINFPTKKHWRFPSRYNYIETGLNELRTFICENQIKSIAIPPLGCGNGKLEWNYVKFIIELSLKGLDGTEILLYEPTFKPEQQFNNAKPELTP
ncbi:MAG: macro domain-containing protein, partial [Ignavibacteriae bacterium]|nr:macro domain-containing protein [Ignavibacteriota bacterium]